MQALNHIFLTTEHLKEDIVIAFIDVSFVKSSEMELAVQFKTYVIHASIFRILAKDKNSVFLLIRNKSSEISENQNFKVKSKPQS